MCHSKVWRSAMRSFRYSKCFVRSAEGKLLRRRLVELQGLSLLELGTFQHLTSMNR